MTLIERQKLVDKILGSQDVAQGAYQYGNWLVGEVFEWLDKNGYEVRKKVGTPLVVVN